MRRWRAVTSTATSRRRKSTTTITKSKHCLHRSSLFKYVSANCLLTRVSLTWRVQIAPGEVNLALSQLAQYNPLIFQTLMNSAGLKDMFNLPAEDPNNVSYNAQLAEAQQHNLAVSSTSLMMPSFALNMSTGGNSLNQSLDLDSNGLNLSSNNLNINNVLYDT